MKKHDHEKHMKDEMMKHAKKKKKHHSMKHSKEEMHEAYKHMKKHGG